MPEQESGMHGRPIYQHNVPGEFGLYSILAFLLIYLLTKCALAIIREGKH